MDLDTKKRHLMRRFGFGASLAERNRLRSMKFDDALDEVLRTDAPDFGHLHQYFCREKEDADVGEYRSRAFWVAQMVTSATPLREKLALFWHSHFAVSHPKVEHGPMMADYLVALRHEPAGPFSGTLSRLTQTPAFLKTLDVHRMVKGSPNENFGRELLELYTLGVGNYSEQDIREIARAFTGWSYDDVYWTLGDSENARLKRMRESEIPAAGFAHIPAFHDPGEKRILGKTGRFDGEAVLGMLAEHPQTARFLCSKLWAFFAGPENGAAIEAMAKRFRATKGDIRETLREMARRNEFYAPEIVGQKVKSPVEFSVGYVRLQKGDEVLREKVGQTVPTVPMDTATFDHCAGIAYHMDLMGQELLNPPTVAGWPEGAAWVSANNMIRRRNFAGIATWVRQDTDGKEHWTPGKMLRYVGAEIRDRKPSDVAAVATALLDIMDCNLSGDSRVALEKELERRQAMEALPHEEWFGGVVNGALDLLRMAPEFQLC